MPAFFVIAQLDALFGAVIKRRRDSHIAIGGKAVGEGADMLVDAENFLNDDDGALGRAVRIGPVGAEGVAVAGGQFDALSHG